MDYTKKTFLIAGAAGFVPGHMAEFYLQKGAKVIGLDNFITGTRTTADYLQKKYPNFTFFEQDIIAGLPQELESMEIDLSSLWRLPLLRLILQKFPWRSYGSTLKGLDIY
jgi:nucleoside-diphosphate-sugar epimerase